MTTIRHALPLTVHQVGGVHLDFRDAAAPQLLWSPHQPGVAIVGTDDWPFPPLALDGLAAGLDREWHCPFGRATFRPKLQGADRWLFIDIHCDGWDGTTLTVWGNRISRFLAEVLHVAVTEDRPAALGELQHDWPTGPLRRGGAA